MDRKAQLQLFITPLSLIVFGVVILVLIGVLLGVAYFVTLNAFQLLGITSTIVALYYTFKKRNIKMSLILIGLGIFLLLLPVLFKSLDVPLSIL